MEPGPRKNRLPVPCPGGFPPLGRLFGKPQRLWVSSAWTFTPVPSARTLPLLPRPTQCGPSPSFPVPLSADPPPAGSFNLDLRFPLPSVPSAQASPPPVPCARILLPPPRSPQLRALPFPGSLQCRSSLAPHLASRQWGLPLPLGSPMLRASPSSPQRVPSARSPPPRPGLLPRGCPLPPRTPHPRPRRSLCPHLSGSRFPAPMLSRASRATPVSSASLHLCPDPPVR